MQHKAIWRPAAILLLISSFSFLPATGQQQYKIRQSSGMMGMNTEPTVYVKGMRKRTEPGKMMGMQQPTTIEQCDLQRTIKINDKKKLYFIEPFAKPNEEIIDEDAPKSKPVAVKPAPAAKPQKGGVIEMWYTITDTGERKQMYGLTARHIWTYQKMKPSPDACYMKDSMIIKTDGWYVDLPQFNCPVHYEGYRQQRPGEMPKPDCQDRYVNHRKGKGKLGFPLIETRTIIMGGSGMPGMNEITTTVNTLEFSAAKLDSMLFEIPLGYTETKNEADLQDKMDVKDMMKEYMNNNNMPGNPNNFPKIEDESAGFILVGIMPPAGGDGQFQPDVLQQNLITRFSVHNMKAVAVSSADEARAKKCTYLLTTDFVKMKQASKVGGLLKAIKNADPNAATSFNIETNMVLTALKDNSVRSKQNISDKFEGKPDDAAGKATDRGAANILNDLN